MTLKRMDNVGVVVDDLAAAVALFKELGLELDGETQVEERSVPAAPNRLRAGAVLRIAVACADVALLRVVLRVVPRILAIRPYAQR